METLRIAVSRHLPSSGDSRPLGDALACLLDATRGKLSNAVQFDIVPQLSLELECDTHIAFVRLSGRHTQNTAELVSRIYRRSDMVPAPRTGMIERRRLDVIVAYVGTPDMLPDPKSLAYSDLYIPRLHTCIEVRPVLVQWARDEPFSRKMAFKLAAEILHPRAEDMPVEVSSGIQAQPRAGYPVYPRNAHLSAVRRHAALLDVIGYLGLYLVPLFVRRYDISAKTGTANAVDIPAIQNPSYALVEWSGNVFGDDYRESMEKEHVYICLKEFPQFVARVSYQSASFPHVNMPYANVYDYLIASGIMLHPHGLANGQPARYVYGTGEDEFELVASDPNAVYQSTSSDYTPVSMSIDGSDWNVSIAAPSETGLGVSDSLFGSPRKVAVLNTKSTVYESSGLCFGFRNTGLMAGHAKSTRNTDYVLFHKKKTATVKIAPLYIGMALNEGSLYPTYAQISDACVLSRLRESEATSAQIRVVAQLPGRVQFDSIQCHAFAWLFTVGCHRGYWICPGETLAMESSLFPSALEIAGVLRSLTVDEFMQGVASLAQQNSFQDAIVALSNEGQDPIDNIFASRLQTVFSVLGNPEYVSDMMVPNTVRDWAQRSGYVQGGIIGAGLLYWLALFAHTRLTRISKSATPVFATLCDMICSFELYRNDGVFAIEMTPDKTVIQNALVAIEAASSLAANDTRRLSAAIRIAQKIPGSINSAPLQTENVAQFQDLARFGPPRPDNVGPSYTATWTKIPPIRFEILCSILLLQYRVSLKSQATSLAGRIADLQTLCAFRIRFAQKQGGTVCPPLTKDRATAFDSVSETLSSQCLVVWYGKQDGTDRFDVYLSPTWVKLRLEHMRLREPNRLVFLQRAMASQKIGIFELLQLDKGETESSSSLSSASASSSLSGDSVMEVDVPDAQAPFAKLPTSIPSFGVASQNGDQSVAVPPPSSPKTFRPRSLSYMGRDKSKLFKGAIPKPYTPTVPDRPAAQATAAKPVKLSSKVADATATASPFVKPGQGSLESSSSNETAAKSVKPDIPAASSSKKDNDDEDEIILLKGTGSALEPNNVLTSDENSDPGRKPRASTRNSESGGGQERSRSGSRKRPRSPEAPKTPGTPKPSAVSGNDTKNTAKTLPTVPNAAASPSSVDEFGPPTKQSKVNGDENIMETDGANPAAGFPTTPVPNTGSDSSENMQEDFEIVATPVASVSGANSPRNEGSFVDKLGEQNQSAQLEGRSATATPESNSGSAPIFDQDIRDTQAETESGVANTEQEGNNTQKSSESPPVGGQSPGPSLEPLPSDTMVRVGGNGNPTDSEEEEEEEEEEEQEDDEDDLFTGL